MNPFLLVDGSPPTLVRIDLKPDAAKDALDMFLKEAIAFDADVVDRFEFDPAYQPAEDECFEIKDFKLPAGLESACVNPLSVPRLSASELLKLPIKGVIGYTGFAEGQKKRIFFQNFSGARVLVPGKRFPLFIGPDNQTFERLQEPLLLLDGRVAAIWENSTLRFKSFTLVNRIFDMTDLFTAATDAELLTFAGHSKLTCENPEKFAKTCGVWTRKKIAIIMRGKRLDNESVAMIQKVAKKVKYPITVKEGKIVLPQNRRELKELLQFLDDDIFEGGISKERFVSSGKRKWVKRLPDDDQDTSVEPVEMPAP